jgi:hypothetical protein
LFLRVFLKLWFYLYKESLVSKKKKKMAGDAIKGGSQSQAKQVEQLYVNPVSNQENYLIYIFCCIIYLTVLFLTLSLINQLLNLIWSISFIIDKKKKKKKKKVEFDL